MIHTLRSCESGQCPRCDRDRFEFRVSIALFGLMFLGGPRHSVVVRVTREQLIAVVRGKRRSVVSQWMAERAVDAVLDEALRVCAPMADDWTGSRCLQALYTLRGGRP